MAWSRQHWITPFAKQCFVVLGVSLFAGQYGMVLGFTAYLLPELKTPGSPIPIDDAVGSWIVSIPTLMVIVMDWFVPWLVERCGRRAVVSGGTVLATGAWLSVAVAADIATLIVARCFQGCAICIGSVIGPVLVGEYSSPHNRGSFLMFLSVFVAGGTFITHLMGAFITWQRVAFTLAMVSFGNLVMMLYTPESPSYLISKGRYEEARKAFVWLRGDAENVELEAMIEANLILKSQNDDKPITSFIHFFKNVKKLHKKPEFYKPFVIMVHLYIVMQFSGIFILAAYAVDITKVLIGDESYIPIGIVSANTQRIITSVFFIYVIKKVKRRTVLIYSVVLNIVSYLATAFYTFAVSKDWFSGHPIVGILLFHLHYFSLAAGSMPLPIIISGEIFPLQYRSFSSVITVMFQTPATFFMLKTLPMLFSKLGLYGAYCIYAGVLFYAVAVALWFLPETKDRTLQDIEDEFRGRKVLEPGVLRPLKDNVTGC